jgi:Flp pilus assembly protein TadG
MIQTLPRMKASQPAKRRGVSTLALVISITVILCFLALSIDVGLLVQRHHQLKTASQAAALAGALELFSSRISDDGTDRINLGRLAASNFAAANQVNSLPLHLSANPLNAVNGDVVLGAINPPELRGLFTPARGGDAPINAVLVRTRHSQTGVTSAALLFSRLVGYTPNDFYSESIAAVDRRVVGFRPVGCTNIPMLPILVHGNPWVLGEGDGDEDSQDRHGEGEGQGEDDGKAAALSDQFTVDPRQFVVAAGPDGIPEFRIHIGFAARSSGGVDDRESHSNRQHFGNQDAWACVLNFGDANPASEQVQFGLNLVDLASSGGQLLAGSEVVCDQDPDIAALQAAFQQMIGKPRVFALGTLSHGSQKADGNLLKFAAGVVVQSQFAESSLTILVQPVAMNSCTGIVRSGAEQNPWVGKVVLIH